MAKAIERSAIVWIPRYDRWVEIPATLIDHYRKAGRVVKER